MSSGVMLQTADGLKESVAFSYEDLVWAYRKFTEEHNRPPIGAECNAANNLPQMRIVNRILQSARVTYKEFIAQFGGHSHVRASANDYDLYVARFIEESNKVGHALTKDELRANSLGLPSGPWLLKNCPDKRVKSYSEFVEWLGFQRNDKVWTREEVIKALKNEEKKLGRPLRVIDIKPNTTGFSMIVVTRLFGSLENARKECGLLRHSVSNELRLSPLDYIDALEDTLIDFYNQTGRKVVTWRDIDCKKYGGERRYTRKTFCRVFNSLNVDLKEYLKLIGFTMETTNFSQTTVFDDGEYARSSLEYDVSLFLRNELNLRYKEDYSRDVKYKTFSETNSRIDCDYVVTLGEQRFFIEVAGMISSIGGAWRTYSFSNPRHSKYRDNLLRKEKLLRSINANYLFIFGDEINDCDKYKQLLADFLNIKK